MDGGLSTEARHSRRLTLRPFHRRDADELHEAVIASLDELHHWLPWAHLNYTRHDAARFIRDSVGSWKDGQAFDFSVHYRDDPRRHIGNVSVWYVSKSYRVGEIGYWVRTDEASKGIATEAAARTLAIAFDELDIHRAILRVAVGNGASEVVADKLGFAREGVLREEIKVRGRWLDHSVWGLLEHEYRRETDRYRQWVEVPTAG